MSFDPEFLRKLEEFGKVLTTRVLDERGVPTFRRDTEVELLERHLAVARNNSFLLAGPSGCGKTAVLHELAARLGARDDEPWIILETSTSQLMAGTQYIGEWQTRVRDMIKLARRQDRVAVYFTDVFNMVGAGRHTKSDENMATFIASYVESGDLTIIGECTPDTLRQGVERFPWFKKLFSIFKIDEQSEADLEFVVRGVAESLAARVQADYGFTLRFPENSLTTIRQFGKIYFPGTGAPGGAVRLLEHLVNAQVTALEKGTLGGDERTAPGDAPAALHRTLGYDDVVRTLESFTGIPSLLLDDSQPLKPTKVRQFFEQRVIGQSQAVGEVIDLITLVKAGVTDPKKPMGVLFFVGPTGVGKTELAKAVAEFIFGSPERMLRFDMSEYKEYDSHQKLIGSPNARDDSPLESGTLLGKVRQQPFSVILLDEIEKAHPNVFDILLQLCGDGRVTDPQGRTTNFTQTIVIMTSNLGSNLQAAQPFGFNQEPEAHRLENDVRLAMEEFFRPEFLNRIDRIITFQPLKQEHVRILAQRELRAVFLRSGIVRRGVHVDVDPGVVDILSREGFSPMFGARPLKRAVERLALVPVARQIVQMAGENRNAVLRLLPAGDRINIRLVESPETKKAEKIAQGVPVLDPVSGRKDRLKPGQIDEELLGLQSAVAMLERQCTDGQLEVRKSALVEQSSQADFWQNPEQARDVSDEIYRIERILDAVKSVQTLMQKAAAQLAEAQRRKDADRLAETVERIRAIRQQADVVQYSLQCRDRLERCDAFVSIAGVDDAVETPDDVVGQIADMYVNWARLKGFEARVVHEELLSPKATREVTLVIEGVAIYGLLSGEEGIHEMIYGRTPQRERLSKFVRVRVLPLVDDRGHAVRRGDLSIEKKKAKGTGRRCPRYKSEVRIVHRPSSVTVIGRSDLSVDEAESLLQELLQAELHRHQYLHPETGSAVADGHRESVIRKYTLKPNPQARDPRTNVTVTRLEELWNGALDEFLNAALMQRPPRIEPAAGAPTAAGS